MSKSAGETMSGASQDVRAPCTDFSAIAPIPALLRSEVRRPGRLRCARLRIQGAGAIDATGVSIFEAHLDLFMANRIPVQALNWVLNSNSSNLTILLN